MKTLAYTRTHNLPKLHEELNARFPTLGNDMVVEGDGTTCRVTVPDSVADADVAAVVAVHDAAQQSVAQVKGAQILAARDALRAFRASPPATITSDIAKARLLDIITALGL